MTLTSLNVLIVVYEESCPVDSIVVTLFNTTTTERGQNIMTKENY